MDPGKYNLTIKQGAVFDVRFWWSLRDGATVETVDPTGYTWEMQIRETLESDTVILELSTANGRIESGVVDPDRFGGEPHVRLILDSTETAVLPSRGQAKYDLFFTPGGGDRDCLLGGAVFWNGAVTR